MDNLFEISSAPMRIVEMAAAPVNGRRNAKLVLHQIFEDNSKWQKNGISWLEGYVRQNMNTVEGMSVTAEFLDDSERREPWGHGFSGINPETGQPEFNDAVMVGHTSNAAIESIELNGEKIQALTANASLDEMRYPLFVGWLFDELNKGNTINGSVEIVGTAPGVEIQYDGGWRKEGRIPQAYVYSGYSILSISAADSAAVILELNSKGGIDMNNVGKEISKGGNEMDEKEILKAFSELNEKIDALNTLEEKINQLAAMETELNAKRRECSELQSALTEAQSKITELEAKIAESASKMTQMEAQAKTNELNAAIKDFSEKDLEVAKEMIDAFKADPAAVEINAIVEKVKASMYDKVMAEINSRNGDKDGKELELMFSQSYKPLDNEDYSSLF